MKSFEYTITDPVGIHARPAGILVKEIKKYASAVTISKGEKSVNALKLMALMGMGIKQGDTVKVTVEGADEDAAAAAIEAFLKANGLEREKFVCVIPRLRWTPVSFDEENFRWNTPEKARVSMEAVGPDMAKMRELIRHVVTTTDLKVLICPEMTYQVPMGRRYLFDPLPEEVKKKVVLKRDYWITDEALGVYKAAHSLVSMEMHSPIMFAVLGRPAILLRQAEDTWKGQMWRDIGLQSWILELNSTPAAEAEAVLDGIIADYPGALKKTAAAMDNARRAGFAAADFIAGL